MEGRFVFYDLNKQIMRFTSLRRPLITPCRYTCVYVDRYVHIYLCRYIVNYVLVQYERISLFVRHQFTKAKTDRIMKHAKPEGKLPQAVR